MVTTVLLSVTVPPSHPHLTCRTASRLEWTALWLIAKDENGVVSKEKVGKIPLQAAISQEVTCQAHHRTI
jgi:hypothetical protein